jgi:hypothetical protein
MGEDALSQVGGHALADPAHQERAREGCRRKQRDDAQHGEQRLVEPAGRAGGEAVVDQPAQAAAEGQHGRRGRAQGQHRARKLRPVGQDEAQEAAQDPRVGTAAAASLA